MTAPNLNTLSPQTTNPQTGLPNAPAASDPGALQKFLAHPQLPPNVSITANSDGTFNVPVDQAIPAVAQGTLAFPKDQDVPVYDKNGNYGTVKGQDVQAALQQGYTLATPRQQAIEQYVKANQGIVGTAKVFGGELADEALFGVPEAIYNRIGDPLDVDKYNALKKDHELASALGNISGFAVNIAAAGPLVKGLGELAGQGLGLGAKIAQASEVSQGVQTLLGTKGVSPFIGKVVGDIIGNSPEIVTKAAQYGTEGVLFSAPQAVVKGILDNNPNEAVESLMAGGLFGALLGGAVPIARPLIKNSVEALSDVITPQYNSLVAKADQAISNKMAAEAPEATSAMGQETSLGSHALNFGGLYALHLIAPHIAGPVAGTVALVKGIAKVISKLTPEQQMKILDVFDNSLTAAGRTLKTIPDILDDMPGSMKQTAAVGAMAQMLGKDAPNDKADQAVELNNRLSLFLTDPGSADQLNRLTSAVGNTSSPAGQALSGKLVQMANIANSIIPKPPSLPNPLYPNTWKPTDIQVAQTEKQLNVLLNPFSVLSKMADGSLSSSEVKVLQQAYPLIYQHMQQRIMQGIQEKNLNIPAPQRLKVQLLLGQPIDKSLSPQAFMGLQSNFGSGAVQGQPRSSAPLTIANNLATPFQTTINKQP